MKILSFFKKGLKLLLLVVGCLILPRMLFVGMHFFEGMVVSITDIVTDDDDLYEGGDLLGIYIEKQKLRAARGDVRAMGHLVDKFARQGFDDERIYWLSREAESDIGVRSLVRLGDYYYEERKDMEKAAEWYIKAYQVVPLRHVVEDKLFCIGMYFEELAERSSYVEEKNIGTAKGYLLKAEEYYRVLAKGGYVPAQKWFAVVQSKQTLDNLRWEAIIKEDANAMFMLAERYFEGRDVISDCKKAVNFYLKAAYRGHAEAQYKLGVCYQYGISIAPDREKAIWWYEQAAAQGNATAREKLAEIKSITPTGGPTGGRGVFARHEYLVKDLCNTAKYYDQRESSRSVAVRLYTQAAEQGDSRTQYWLGYFYQHGNGVAPDREKAIEWYEKAAAQGDAFALDKLKEIKVITPTVGACWNTAPTPATTGNVTPTPVQKVRKRQDMSEAVRYYAKTAKMGHSEAQYKLGHCYQHGIGVASDREKAIEWYEKAAAQGHAAAREKLEEMRNHRSRESGRRRMKIPYH